MKYNLQNIQSQYIGSWKNYNKIFRNMINENEDLIYI